MKSFFPPVLTIILSGFLLAPGLLLSTERTGEQVYMLWCDGCHMDSPFAPGTIQLRQMRGQDKGLIRERKDLSADYIRQIVRQGQNGMPLFRRTEISATELEDLVEYLVDN